MAMQQGAKLSTKLWNPVKRSRFAVPPALDCWFMYGAVALASFV